MDRDYEEYFILTEMLEETDWALEGECNDIDCDKYMHKNLLKKKYKPVLEHNFSCLNKLKKEKTTILRLLSQKKFKKYRYTRCNVCKKYIDRLYSKNTIVSFTRQSKENKNWNEWKGIWSHNRCKSKVEIPNGWKRF